MKLAGSRFFASPDVLYDFYFHFCLSRKSGVDSKDCDIPFVVRGTWFHRDNGEYFTTEINSDSMTDRGTCLYSHSSGHVNYTFVFHDEQTTCYHCVNFFVRTVNILDKVECNFQILSLNDFIVLNFRRIRF